MEIYLLKSGACLAIFLFFYKFFLEKESMHMFKRFYLLFALLIAYIIPLITFTYYVESTIESNAIASTNLNPITIVQEEGNSINWSFILWTIYSLGVLFFSIKFLVNIAQVFKRIYGNPKLRYSSFINVLLSDSIIPHTFFNYIFLNKQKFESREIPKEVLLHEQTHAKQKHSIDIILIELFQIIFWFNPLIYLIKHAIKLNHEFLADQAVLNQGVHTSKYQQLLLAFSSHAVQPQLANAINYSLIKKRFNIMKTQTSKKGVWLRSFILLPLLSLLVFSFSSKKEIEKTEPETSSDVILQQKGASKEQMAEYNKLVKHYNNMLASGHIKIYEKDLNRLEYLYSIMSDKQRKDAEAFPDFPEPPPTPDAPKAPKFSKVEMIPPPPPLPPDPTKAEIKKYKAAVSEYKKRKEMVPPPPPPPNAPPTVEEMAEKGAIFYLEGKRISSKEAIDIVNKNKSINIEILNVDSKQPTVKLSKKGITFKKKKTKAQANINLETGNIKINGKEHLYAKKDGHTSYFNEQGETVDQNGKVLTNQKRKPTFYFNGKQISSDKANKLLSNNTSIAVTTEDYNDKEYAIVLSDLSKMTKNPNNINHNVNHNPNAIIDLTDAISKGATFYYNDVKISTEKAQWLTKHESIERVQTKEGKDGKLEVYFWKKA